MQIGLVLIEGWALALCTAPGVSAINWLGQALICLSFFITLQGLGLVQDRGGEVVQKFEVKI